MAITENGQLTTDDDLVKATFEPNLTRFLTGIDETMADYTQLHVSANNAILDRLRMKGIDPSKINNTYTFKLPSLYFVLAHIYLGRIEEPGDSAETKYLYYMKMFNDYMEDPAIELSEEDETISTNVVVSNIDDHSRLKLWPNIAGDADG